jgi:multicomponent Na+:H+ antiporter subunit F
MNTLYTAMLATLAIALLATLGRLARGPSLPTRVVALDLMASLVVGIIAVQAVVTGQAILLDVAAVLALVAFLGTIAFARFIEKGDLPWRRA